MLIRRKAILGLAGLLLATTGGCGQRPILDPIQEATRPTATTSRRVAAIHATPNNQAPGLMPLVYSSRHPSQVRQAAVDRMIQADADAFWRNAANSIRRIDDWPMLTLLAKRAAIDQRSDFIPALIQSWARPSIRFLDDERPERLAILHLTPGRDLNDTLWEHFTAPPQSPQGRRAVQTAWTVLCRTHADSSLRDRLLNTQPRHALHAQLALVAPSIERLPGDREAILRMRTLIESSNDEDWQQWGQTSRLNPTSPGRSGIALRHLPAIAQAQPSTSGERLRGELIARLTQRLATVRHISRGEGDHGHAVIQSTPDTLADHVQGMGWADLLIVTQVLEALDHPALSASLFAQADRDKADTQSEHGGVLTWEAEGKVVAHPFAPLMRRHDEIYIASDDCIEAMHTGLAHYHFHAQRYNNAAWAGPGGGDFAFANNLHANCVVFTFIDRDTLNVDVYFPGKVVIDLGCIRR